MKLQIESNSFGYAKLNKWVNGTVSDSLWRVYQNSTPGATVYSNEGVAFPIHTHDILVIPAWTIWIGELKETPVEHSHISFNTPMWSTYYSRKNFPNILRISKDHEHYNTINSCFEYLRDHLKSFNQKNINKELFFSMRDTAINLTLACVFKESPIIGDARPANISKVLDYIDSHISEDLSIEKLASIQLCATAHFSRMFKKLMNQSPSAYIRERRVTKASQLLITTQKSIEQIAELCGFYDRFHFSKNFKTLMKRSPVQYKKIHTY